jgi:large-conductance mechanosensitive channel
MSFISGTTWVQDFGIFMKDSQILPMALGFLIATSTMDMSKSLVGTTIMPIIEAVRSMKTPKFHVSSLVAAVITFIITISVTFTIIKLFRLQAKPIQPVLVANAETRMA